MPWSYWAEGPTTTAHCHRAHIHGLYRLDMQTGAISKVQSQAIYSVWCSTDKSDTAQNTSSFSWLVYIRKRSPLLMCPSATSRPHRVMVKTSGISSGYGTGMHRTMPAEDTPDIHVRWKFADYCILHVKTFLSLSSENKTINKVTKGSQPLVGRSSPYCEDM